MPGDNPPRAGHAVSGGQSRVWSDEELCSQAAGGCRRWRFAHVAALLASSSSAALTASTARAASETLAVGTFEVIQVAVSVGVVSAALLSAVWLIRERARTFAENTLLRGRVADLNAALQRTEAMLNLRDQRVVVWGNEHKKPELVGTLPM